jgi:TRAP-type transport system small permease protein
VTGCLILPQARKDEPPETYVIWHIKLLEVTVETIKSISRITGLVAMGVLFLMMLLTVADVFLRAVFNKPIIGTTEITEQMMVAVVFLGFGWCALQDKQISVDLFVSRYRPHTRQVVDVMTHSVGLVLVAVICWRTFVMTLSVQQLGITCAYIGVPKYPFYALATFGWAVLFVAIAGLLVTNVQGRTER